MVTTFANKPIAQSKCRGCGECVAVCPVGALAFKEGEAPLAGVWGCPPISLPIPPRVGD
jgi:ferredoxin